MLHRKLVYCYQGVRQGTTKGYINLSLAKFSLQSKVHIERG
jgi:hypothetical protein